MLCSTLLFLSFCIDFGIAETGIARGSPPGTTTEVLRVGFPFAEIRVVSLVVDEAEVLSKISTKAMREKWRALREKLALVTGVDRLW
jgi:hypothetical protein